MRPHRREPTRLPRPWDSPGKNTGVGVLCLGTLKYHCLKFFSHKECVVYFAGKNPPFFCLGVHAWLLNFLKQKEKRARKFSQFKLRMVPILLKWCACFFSTSALSGVPGSRFSLAEFIQILNVRVSFRSGEKGRRSRGRIQQLHVKTAISPPVFSSAALHLTQSFYDICCQQVLGLPEFCGGKCPSGLFTPAGLGTEAPSVLKIHHIASLYLLSSKNVSVIAFYLLLPVFHSLCPCDCILIIFFFTFEVGFRRGKDKNTCGQYATFNEKSRNNFDNREVYNAYYERNQKAICSVFSSRLKSKEKEMEDEIKKVNIYC